MSNAVGGGTAAATIIPPIAGPVLRATLKPMLSSAAADGGEVRGAMSPYRRLPWRSLQGAAGSHEEGT